MAILPRWLLGAAVIGFVRVGLPPEWLTAQKGVQARQMAGMKKPAQGGPGFPGIDVVVCSISTLLHTQLIIVCADQLSDIDRCERSVLPQASFFR
ncbi:hypothetical protein [Serratia marcescens]|uniref:hypothetical protein n=1 Tax=Serratia marcescens TaxID=615 RepID=UPI00131A313D|nr:hypothetical protein [Serratia marcescens]MBH2974504.1 hypothetical protein [Serratia marcescens]MBH2979230.1 hypothetical protein [Serratia marcescens]MBN5323891.1 hypothetical protein [Serratia marcescens]MBN5347128.1 hypothetical protein [Serratia marcescens]MDU0859444.1 hypothetical protein [Serratia marcescens]